MYNRDKYQERKKHGLCVKCGKDVQIEGSVLCLECNIKQIKYNDATRRKDGYKEKQNNARNTLRQKRHELGLCRCGRKVSDKNHVTCLECRIKANRMGYESKLRNGKIKGVKYSDKCIWCGGGVVDGRIFCEDCLKIKQDILKKNRKCD